MVRAAGAARVLWQEPREERRQHRAPRPRRRAARAASRFAVTLLAVAGLLLWVGAREARLAALGYDLVELRAARDAELAEMERLEVELARLSSPQHVDAVARRELGMTDPEQVALATVAPLPPSEGASRPATVAVLSLPGDRTAAVTSRSASEGAVTRLAGWLYAWLTGTRTAEARTLQP